MSSTPPSAKPAWNEFQALVEQVEDYAMFVLDLEGRVASWNRGAQRIKRYLPEQIVGQHFSKFYPPEDLTNGKPARELEIALAEGHVEDEGWRVRADGTRFWAFVSITLLRDDEGVPRGFAKVTRDLTERRNVQEALRRSEERFRLLVEGVGDYAIYMLDPRGCVATWNTGAQKIKGYTASEIIGRDFRVFFREQDQADGRPQAELKSAAAEGRFAEEGWRVRADGTRFWASVVLTALRDQAGELVGYSKITRDLTARKLAETTARELQAQQHARAIAEAAEGRAQQERERFRLLSEQLDVVLEGVDDGIVVQDREGRVRFANSAAARWSGLDAREELIDRDVASLLSRFELSDEQGQPVAPERLPGSLVREGELAAAQLLQLRERASRDLSWLQMRSNAVCGPDGRVELAVEIWHDVTQQRRSAEQDRYLGRVTEALSASLTYRHTLDALADLLVPGLCDWCIVHLLEQGRPQSVAVAHADPAKKALVQAYAQKYLPDPASKGGIWQVLNSGEPVLHQPVEQLLLQNARDAEQLRAMRQLDMRAALIVPIEARDEVRGAMTLIVADSGRRYDAHDLALVKELGRRVGVFIDNALLFERAQLAAARAAAAADEAEAAGRLKDEFLATVSHELRTPLNAILGWASVLRTRSDPASVSKGIAVIYRNAVAQSKLIEDILDVSRIITGKLRLELKQADLGAIVADALEAVRSSALARDIRVEFERPSEPHVLVADAERLQQVLWNLLSNAVKFSERGSRVEVKLERSGSQLSVVVADEGRGIDPAFLPYVFERFKQADSSTTRRFGGLGLGLSIVRHLVELHGGQVSVTSPGLGQGATFSMRLPVQATLPPSEAPSPATDSSEGVGAHAAQLGLEGVRVLVVDDEPDARDLLELVLSQAGARVVTASSAAEAFARLNEMIPDVIVSDIGMPDEDGYSLMRRVRTRGAEFAHIPAIALTAFARNEDRNKALAMGFTRHLGKPVDSNELAQLVAQLAGRSAS